MRTLFSIRFVACCIFSKGVDRRAGKTSFATEIKKADQMRHQGAGETHVL